MNDMLTAPGKPMKARINKVPLEVLVKAYELLSIGATVEGVAERFKLNRSRLNNALWIAKNKGLY